MLPRDFDFTPALTLEDDRILVPHALGSARWQLPQFDLEKQPVFAAISALEDCSQRPAVADHLHGYNQGD